LGKRQVGRETQRCGELDVDADGNESHGFVVEVFAAVAKGKKTCPRCAAEVGPSDTVCVECGCPLEPEQDDDARPRPEIMTHVHGAASTNAAAAGVALPGETSEKTRLRVFDEHLAEKLIKARPAIIVLAIISVVAGLILTFAAGRLLAQIGGFAALKDIDLIALRAKRFGMIWDPQVLFVISGGLSLAGYLCGLGELMRFIASCRAIAAVKAGEIPNVVGLAALTHVGLLVGALVLPPLGIVLGIVFKVAEPTDLKELGGQMLYISFLVVAIVLGAILWDAMAEMAGRHKPLSSVR